MYSTYLTHLAWNVTNVTRCRILWRKMSMKCKTDYRYLIWRWAIISLVIRAYKKLSELLHSSLKSSEHPSLKPPNHLKRLTWYDMRIFLWVDYIICKKSYQLYYFCILLFFCKLADGGGFRDIQFHICKFMWFVLRTIMRKNMCIHTADTVWLQWVCERYWLCPTTHNTQQSS